MSFSRQLLKFRNKTLKKYEDVKRLSALSIFTNIVYQTPVDKGTLRNNWFAEIGRPSNETTSQTSKSGQDTVARIKQVLAGTDLDKDTFLTNNLPYSIPIEFGDYPDPPKGGQGKVEGGFSTQAPAGMVRINVERWKGIVEANVRIVNSGL